MSGSDTILYVFAISHYCEKARWALDYCGISYTERCLAPGEHRKVAKSLGAPQSSLPILTVDGAAIQGSGAIIDWAEARAADPQIRLTPEGEAGEAARAIEARLDEVIGVHVRRYYYCEAMVEYPESVRPIFSRDLPLVKRFLLKWKWPVVRDIMIKRMDLGREQFDESEAILTGELDWLDGLLADGRSFLAGEKLSRADLAAASLLAPLAAPPEHPTYGELSVPPRVAARAAEWQSRPVIRWVRDLYAKYR